MTSSPAVRGVIGEPIATQLDAMVAGALQKVAARAQMDLLARQPHTLHASRTGGRLWPLLTLDPWRLHRSRPNRLLDRIGTSAVL